MSQPKTGAQEPQRPGTSTKHASAATPSVTAVRALQRCATDCSCCGKDDEERDGQLGVLLRAAVQARTLARATATEAPPAATLSSSRFRGEPLLEACHADKARMGQGSRDTGGAKPVSKVQQALTDLGLELGGADGIYGAKTAAAVREFKTREKLGFTQYGDVGPGTMRRLDELFAEPLPVCELPGPDIASADAKALTGNNLASPTSNVLGFVIPGVTCQIKTGPAITSLATVPAAVRAKIQVITNEVQQNEVDGAFQIFKGGLKSTGSIAQDEIFGAGVTTDKDVRDGLVSVAGMLNRSKPPFDTNQTVTLRINDVPGRKPPAKQPGGVYRFTRFKVPGPANESMLIEHLGAFINPPSTATSDQKAFEAKYSSFGYKVAFPFPADQFALLDQALQRVGDKARNKAKGLTFSRAGKPPKGEAGEYNPNTKVVTIFVSAFNPTATSPGGLPLSEWTMAHEMGHALSDLDKGVKAAFDKAAAKDGMKVVAGKVTNALTNYGATTTEENFAECFALHAMNPSELAALRPNVAAVFSARY